MRKKSGHPSLLEFGDMEEAREGESWVSVLFSLVNYRLEAKRHHLSTNEAMGSAQTIMLAPDGLLGVADPRSRGAKAVGY